MSTPVITETWAGTLECEGPCRRKRLTASEFSKKAIEKYRKPTVSSKPYKMRCKQCVSESERKEREAAEQRRRTIAEKEAAASSSTDTAATTLETHPCSGPCKRFLPASSFNRNQLSKKDKARCPECVEKAIEEEKKSNDEKIIKEITEAKEAVKKAEKKGNAIEMLKTTTHLAALESQLVTGVKPKKLGRRVGRKAYGPRGK